MTSIMHAVVTLEPASGFRDEAVVNTFTAATNEPLDVTQANLFAFNVLGFYNQYQGGGNTQVSDFISGSISRATDACSIAVYNITGHLDGSPHGSPMFEEAWTLGPSVGADDLPAQVASVITLRGRGALAAPVEGAVVAGKGTRPRARKTGRLFMGPLNRSAETTSGAGISRSSAGWRNVANNACEELQAQMVADDHIWCIWSRSNANVYGVTSSEIDNSFDVLRSRKSLATERAVTTFAAVPALALGA